MEKLENIPHGTFLLYFLGIANFYDQQTRSAIYIYISSLQSKIIHSALHQLVIVKGKRFSFTPTPEGHISLICNPENGSDRYVEKKNLRWKIR